MLLAALAVPALAEEDVLGQMDRQVAALVRRVGPSVVSVRVGPGRSRAVTPRRQRGRAGTESLQPGAPASIRLTATCDELGESVLPLQYQPARLAMFGGGPAMALFQSTR